MPCRERAYHCAVILFTSLNVNGSARPCLIGKRGIVVAAEVPPQKCF